MSFLLLILIQKYKISKIDEKRGLHLPTENSRDLAYLCGVLTGDGSIYTRPTKHDYIIKCVGNPKDEREFYQDIISPMFKKVFGIKPNIQCHDSNTTFGFVIYSKTLFDYLTKQAKLPEGRKYDSLKIPNKIKQNDSLCVSFLRGLFDTDGCISFKKKYRDYPYYPVISLSSKSKILILEVSNFLKKLGFKIVETYDYQYKDPRAEKGFTVINRLEMNGKENLKLWTNLVSFSSPKHLKKLGRYSGKRI